MKIKSFISLISILLLSSLLIASNQDGAVGNIGVSILNASSSGGGGGGGGTWALMNTGGTTLSGASHVDQVGLTACTDVAVVLTAGATVSSTTVAVRVSIDGGATFIATGYQSINGNGSVGAVTGLDFDSLGASTSARSGTIEISQFNVVGPKTSRSNVFSVDGILSRIIPTTTAFNAVQIVTGTGNFNAGTVYFYCR